MYRTNVRIKCTKKYLLDTPTTLLEVPQFLYINTINTRCKKYDLYIKEGDQVKLGQVIGQRHGEFFEQNMYSTCSGKFISLEDHYYKDGRKIKFVKLENDFKDEKDDTLKERTDEEIESLNKDDLISIIKDRAVVGLSGSSFPTYVKLETNNKINTVLLNAIEVDRDVYSDRRLIFEKFDQIYKGIKLLLKTYECNDARICIKKSDKNVIEFLQNKLNEINDPTISIVKINNYYAEGWETNMVKNATKIVVEQGKHPTDYGVSCFNIATTCAIYDAIKYNSPIIDKLITVSGDGISIPKILRVRIGSPITSLIQECGGLIDNDIDKCLMLNGPMMGISLPNDDSIISPSITSLNVMDKKEYKAEPCIRCGACTMACPVGIMPFEIANTMQTMPVNKERLKALNPSLCLECGLCTYSCPSKIQLQEIMKRAKLVSKL